MSGRFLHSSAAVEFPILGPAALQDSAVPAPPPAQARSRQLSLRHLKVIAKLSLRHLKVFAKLSLRHLKVIAKLSLRSHYCLVGVNTVSSTGLELDLSASDQGTLTRGFGPGDPDEGL
eukprot:1195809-Prorocentrum_minimum.AAC.4